MTHEHMKTGRNSFVSMLQREIDAGLNVPLYGRVSKTSVAVEAAVSQDADCWVAKPARAPAEWIPMSEPPKEDGKVWEMRQAYELKLYSKYSEGIWRWAFFDIKAAAQTVEKSPDCYNGYITHYRQLQGAIQ